MKKILDWESIKKYYYDSIESWWKMEVEENKCENYSIGETIDYLLFKNGYGFMEDVFLDYGIEDEVDMDSIVNEMKPYGREVLIEKISEYFSK